MNVLAIETSTEQLGVALVDEARVLASYELLAEHPHAIELPAAVTRVLEAAGLSLHDIEALAVDIGPGSFTGLRIGIAFVKALAFCHRKPVVGVPSLDVLAAQLPFAPHRVCPILDAKQRKLYAALYRMEGGTLKRQSDHLLLGVEELLPRLGNGPVILLGDGVARYREALTSALGDRALIAAPEFWFPGAATLGRLGLERFRQGARDDPAALVPMYLYPRDCTIRPTPAVSTPATSR
ncbi:MAG: tRNA (adenosine(37)-N6)-threonylcarbamoyltransferase complex dimerization subunit type 1 TsaB [Omnitrophica WOR_2 bacterium RIFCSPLOWO2_02_FULL_63_16]|nr:MAG: tRNA (adenosine(37)-N6)-threonylcarbamoyltransferase complex dimerization subunit type 1 TsaB [Omnitrophica WOR_2 bacterium GWA2_63_20]OGX32268.1 MAG: tRNA (adenosine(37)-N6)-threonylcarbamoyltransferase complex dimerization subunit type 1 TsaB [Omnitrophica WOR_2 bacterium RIFCSPHIGHO2_12_FULL_64_13]OGX35406.1 MAG: tRNA (adenosine(37)-N6)-threonylcarbamoyltransferase complex dimerization subunit type 1 TsaB [Omnitrophica WOR_2 bacterium RIFCSPHIGHO2_02_FULL_63_39]OGX45426.1 MAG: tRNA (a